VTHFPDWPKTCAVGVLINKGSIVTRLRFAGRENNAISVFVPASLPEKWGQSFVL